MHTTVMRRHNLKDAGTAKTFERLCRRVGLALLRCKERVSDVDPDRARERLQFPERRSDPPDGFQFALHFYTSIHIYIYEFQPISQAATDC